MAIMSIRIIAALLLATLPLSAPAATTPTAAAVLAQVRAATLFRPFSTIHSVRTTSSIVAVGLHATGVEFDDVTGERFVQHTSGSNMLGGANGFDGNVSWSQDRSGIVLIDGGRSTHYQNVDQAYMQAFAYLRPDMGGASATYVGERHTGSRVYDIVELTPPGGTPLNISIDAQTNRIAQIEGTIGIVSSTAMYSDYRLVDGVEIPFHVAQSDSNGNSSEVTVTACEINAPGLEAALQIPHSSAHDFSIANGTSTTVPLSIINNHLYVHVMLDGKGPFTFIFDTGGANILTPAVAAALQARSTGGANVSGVGATTEAAQFTHVNALQIGAATLRDQDFVVLPIGSGFGMAEGVNIDGMFGPAVPERFLTAIDYARGTLTLALQGSIAPAGAVVPFFFDGTIPVVPVTIDGVAAHADLDTGNRGQLFLTSPFLASHSTLAAKATTANAVTGFGIGGPSFGRLGRIDVLQIGPYALQRVVGDFATQTTGATADPFTDANVGGGAWDRFVLTLDYPNERIYLAPNERYGTPFTTDRSGLFLIDYHDSIVVLGVTDGTPAAAAGLHKGDTVVSVNGSSATSYTLAELRELFMSAPGTNVVLHVRSGSTERDVTLKLADYV